MDSFALLKFWHRTIPSHHVATRDGSDPEDDDDGPFFDLEFDDEGKKLYPVGNASASEGQDDKDCSCLDSECSDPDDSSDCTSDDDHIFFKGDLLPISPSTDDATMPKTAHFPVSLMKSSARLRVFMSGLKKPVLSQENPGNRKPESEPRKNIQRLFIKFKVEEKPLVSLFARDNTKPSLGKPVTGVRAGLRVVCQQLGKSRSGSSSVAAAPGASVVDSRRDDSLLQQQDGIQGAILHCKRSFNESRDLDLAGFRRSASDPSDKKLMESAGREQRLCCCGTLRVYE